MRFPTPAPDRLDAEDDPFPEDIETVLRRTEGGVRGALVQQIKKLVETDPDVFIRNLRNWLNVGRHDD